MPIGNRVGTQYGKMYLKECESRRNGPFAEVAGLKIGGRTVVLELVVQLKVPLRL